MAFPSATIKSGSSWRIWFSYTSRRRNRACPQYYGDKQCGLELHTTPTHRPSLLLCKEEQGLRLSGIYKTNSHRPQAPGHPVTMALGPQRVGAAALAHPSTPLTVRGGREAEARRARAAGGLEGVPEGRGLCPTAEDHWQEQHGKEAGNMLSPVLRISFQVLRISCFH